MFTWLTSANPLRRHMLALDCATMTCTLRGSSIKSTASGRWNIIRMVLFTLHTKIITQFNSIDATSFNH